MNLQVKEQSILRDTKTLAQGTPTYDYFPSQPTAGGNNNYKSNPFPAAKTFVNAISARIDQSAEIVRAAISNLQTGQVVLVRDGRELSRFPLEYALGVELAGAHDGTDAQIIVMTKGAFVLNKPIEVSSQEQFEVKLKFTDDAALPEVPLMIDLHTTQTN